MKKIGVVCLSAALLFTLGACGNKSAAKDKESSATSSMTSKSSTESKASSEVSVEEAVQESVVETEVIEQPAEVVEEIVEEATVQDEPAVIEETTETLTGASEHGYGENPEAAAIRSQIIGLKQQLNGQLSQEERMAIIDQIKSLASQIGESYDY